MCVKKTGDLKMKKQIRIGVVMLIALAAISFGTFSEASSQSLATSEDSTKDKTIDVLIAVPINEFWYTKSFRDFYKPPHSEKAVSFLNRHKLPPEKVKIVASDVFYGETVIIIFYLSEKELG